MIKKIIKLVLLVMMLAGAFITVSNIADKKLNADFSVRTYYPNIPDCKNDAKDCNVFTFPIEPQ